MAVDDGNRDDNLERQPELARLLQAAGGEEPPAALDAALLAAARREVSPRPQGVGGSGEAATPVPRQKRNWYVPLSIAAVLVMSVSLVTLVHQEKGDALTQPPRVTQEPAPATAAAPPAAEPQPAELPQDAVAPKPDATLRATAPLLTSKVEAGLRLQTVPPAVAESSASDAQKQRNETAQRDAVTEGIKPLAQAASPAAPARPDAPPAVAADRPSAAASPAPALAARTAQQRSGPQQMTRPPWLIELDNQPLEKWLERLAQFKREGRVAEADALMSEFRRRFPDHPSGAG